MKTDLFSRRCNLRVRRRPTHPARTPSNTTMPVHIRPRTRIKPTTTSSNNNHRHPNRPAPTTTATPRVLMDSIRQRSQATMVPNRRQACPISSNQWHQHRQQMATSPMDEVGEVGEAVSAPPSPPPSPAAAASTVSSKRTSTSLL